MKAGDIIEALERFFLDLIGQVVPGFCLLLSGALLWPDAVTMISKNPTFRSLGFDQVKWTIIVVLAYVAGHGVTSIGDALVFPVIDRVVRVLRKIKLGFWIPRNVVAAEELFGRIQGDPVFRAFTADAAKLFPSLSRDPTEKITVASWRNIAMSIATEQRNTVYRFMFISLLNLGITTVLLLVAALWLIVAWLQSVRAIPGHTQIVWPLWALLVVGSLPFLERRYVFFRIATEVPFSMALFTLWEKEKKSATTGFAGNGRTEINRPLTVYLAGGFQTGWQDKIKEAAPQFRYFDPRSHCLQDRGQYSMWDLEAIRRSDWTFAYLEANNPGGYALAAEIGYAKALGKRVILVNEKRTGDQKDSRYFDLLSATCDVEISSLAEGIEFLRKLQVVV